MGALLTLPVSLLNLLLPFTKPGTPLAQDLIHTAVLCGTLYYAPQIAEWYSSTRHHQHQHQHQPTIDDDNTLQNTSIHQHPIDAPPIPPERPHHPDPPLDERLVLQPSDSETSDSDSDIAPPPLAPTPPHLPHIPQQVNPGPEHPRPTPANRTVGAKKAKSLARKDQRRAYHEFHRQEAELRRLREAEGAEEREREAAAERERRRVIEAEIAGKEREERVRRKEELAREIEEENARRERVVESVRREVRQRGCMDLLAAARGEGKDRMWVLKLVKASGVVQQLEGQGEVGETKRKVLITGDGWLVRLDEEVMAQAYRDAETYALKNGGRVGLVEMGGILERAVLARAKA